MKKLFILLLSALSLTVVAQQTVALLEPRIGDGSTPVTAMEENMVRGELRKAIVNLSGYEAITRADIDQMMKEQNFQRTGLVSDSQIKKLGEMSGADYICVATLTKSNTEFYLEAYLIHLESGRMSNPASQYGELINGKLVNMLSACKALAEELFRNTTQQTSHGNTFQTHPLNSISENLTIDLDISSWPHGADVEWRIVSKNLDVMNQNFKYLGTTNFDGSVTFKIPGLTASNIDEVSLELKFEKRGYQSRIMKYNLQSLYREDNNKIEYTAHLLPKQ